MWTGELHMRIVIYKALKTKISIWKIPTFTHFSYIGNNALGDPNLDSRSSRH